MGKEILRGKAVGNCDGIDQDEARRALSLLGLPPHQVELRPLPSARSVVLPAADVDGLARAADAAEQSGNTVYLVLNPVTIAGQPRATRDADVVVRRWLFFDLDPVKATGAEKQCATDGEKAAAGGLAADLAAYLSANGFPLPVQIDSGNGYYLHYLFGQPNDPVTKALVRKLVKTLKARFDGGAAVIDGTVTNAARLAKLPGTLNRKGENTPERPHRRCRIIRIPDELEAVSLDAVRAVAGVEAEQTNGAAAERSSPWQGRTKGQGTDAYSRKALAEEVGRIFLAIPGPQEGRNNAVNRASFSLGQLVAGGVLTESEVRSAVLAAALAVGLDEAEAGRTFQSGFDAGRGQPRGVPEKKAESNGRHGAGGGPPSDEPAYRASTVKTRPVRWLWPRRIPMGKLTTFAGIMGVGKTFLLCDVTARLSAGLEWPDLPGEKIEPADVLFISGEDDPEDTLVPRMIECGADLNRVWFLKLDELTSFTLKSLDTLDRVAAQCDGLRLVIIDPPTSYLGDVDDHKNAELRRLLTPLKHWTAARMAGCLFNTHLNKGGGQKVEALFRVIGSVAWMAAVRAGHVIARDPDDREKRLFVSMKLTNGREAQALAYTIEDQGEDRGKLVWLGGVDVTADQAVNREKGRTRRVVASEWLIDRFRENLEWASDDLFRAAKAANVSRNAIFEAKESLCLPKARKDVAESGNVSWIWWVPPDWPPLAPPAPPTEGEAPMA